jgi:hypothetical protein
VNFPSYSLKLVESISRHIVDYSTPFTSPFLRYQRVQRRIWRTPMNSWEPGWRSRYSDTLRAGRSGDRIRWDDIFRTYPDPLRGPPSLLYNGYRVFPGSKGSRGLMLTTHPILVPRLRKRWAVPPLTLWLLLGLLRGSLMNSYFLHLRVTSL